MVARREQGAVGNVSIGEWGNSRENVITNSRIPGKNWWKMEKSCPVATWVSICSTPLRFATNGHGCWYGDTQKWAVLTIARVGGCKGESRRTGWF